MAGLIPQVTALTIARPKTAKDSAVFKPHPVAPESTENALHIVFQCGELLSDMRSNDVCLIADAQVTAGGWQIVRQQFMGFWHELPCFALEIDESHELDPLQYQRGNLYQILGRVDEQLFALAGRAAQLLDWERDHQYCGRCGIEMQVDPVERAMRCAPCNISHFPKIAPCVIVLVTRGDELLLARNVNFPRPMYSTLAGFIEAGETAEDTLAREVREEVGVEIENIRYFHSQSWPFPNQLMLGFFADHAGGDIVCDQVEIADAQWFHFRDLPMIPPASSVAGRLIRHYVDQLERNAT
ncbi:MAG: NAD(+) diphosphatase [Pseudomonadota bacterium]